MPSTHNPTDLNEKVEITLKDLYSLTVASVVLAGVQLGDYKAATSIEAKANRLLGENAYVRAGMRATILLAEHGWGKSFGPITEKEYAALDDIRERVKEIEEYDPS